jgi:hypothetical protein
MKEKFVIVTALAFSDQQDTKRLSEFASKGLMLKDYRIPLLSYRLLPAEKQKVDFLIDFQQNASSEYIDSYAQNGWQLVFAHEDLHYFKADKGTPTFYSDIEGKTSLYRKESKRYGLYAILSLIPLSLFGFLFSTFRSASEIVTLPLFMFTGLSIMSFIFCIMPFVTYHFRANKLNNNG